MIPILRAPPLFGRTGRSSEPVHYVAMAFSPGRVDLYTSDTGEKFRPRGIRGDIRRWMKSGTLAFYFYGRAVVFNGAMYVALKHTATGSSVSRALIFKSVDGIEFNRVSHPLEGPSAGLQFGPLAVGAGYIAGILNDGRTVISSDGTTFVQGAATGLTGLATTTPSIVGSGSVLVIAGNNGQLLTTSAPQTSWTARTSQFGTTQIVNLAAGNVFLAMGLSGKIATAPISNPATWTLRRSAVSLLGIAAYRAGRWFVSGDEFLTATDSLSFSASDPYWDTPTQERLWSFLDDGSKLLAFYGNGHLAKNESGTAWTQVEGSGLPVLPFQATAYLPPA